MIEKAHRGIKMERADMTELADVQDLGSCARWRVGSNPTIRIEKNNFPSSHHGKSMI